ncbi:MAG: hypothetical protein E6G07_13385 [Actinobacteria bacterium]|nr:MAG: hypothetical protein E6G53_06445 [Actinomycetota bacterium]TML75007.1 MAG: hypothetical protein E6G07_13385 [Actinomycetota bacterium]
MADATRSESGRRPRPAREKLSLGETWRRLNLEQRVAAVGALLLIISTLGPFSFVEAAIVLIGASVLLLLRRRSQGREFHIPFGDGAIIAAAGAWAAVLILVRLFSRPLGQGLLALVCAAILVLAGIREHAKRPADDLPEEARVREPPAGDAGAPDAPFADLPPRTEPVPDRAAYRDETLPLPGNGPPGAEAALDEPAPRSQPAKVLPPAPREQDLKQPPNWEHPSKRD